MRIRAFTYDAKANALYIAVGDPDRNVHRSKEISEDISVDLAEDGEVIGYDIQWASQTIRQMVLAQRLLEALEMLRNLDRSVLSAEDMAFVDEVISEADPDAGLEWREDYLRELRDSMEAVENGTAVLIPAEDVYRELGLG